MRKDVKRELIDAAQEAAELLYSMSDGQGVTEKRLRHAISLARGAKRTPHFCKICESDMWANGNHVGKGWCDACADAANS